MPCFATRCPGRPPYVLFPLTAGLPPDELPLLLRKQPIWEQGLAWHPVATALAGQAIPFIVAASHAHALPSAPFWFPVPAVLVASPALLCPSSLSAVLALVPLGVAPAFCVSVLLLPLSVGAPGCPCRAPPPVPPTCPPVRGFHISVRRGLSRARSRLCCHPRGGHLPATLGGQGLRRQSWTPVPSTWSPLSCYASSTPCLGELLSSKAT